MAQLVLFYSVYSSISSVLYRCFWYQFGTLWLFWYGSQLLMMERQIIAYCNAVLNCLEETGNKIKKDSACEFSFSKNGHSAQFFFTLNMCLLLLIKQMHFFPLMWNLVPAHVMGHPAIYGLHLDDNPLGSPCAQPGCFCCGR